MVLGGQANDTITTGSNEDLILGDNGNVTYTAGVATFLTTSQPDVGGNDTIDGGDGNNVVLGGTADDTITTGRGEDLLLGDNGNVTFDAAGTVIFATSSDPTIGGADTITAGIDGSGDGRDRVFGGTGNDEIHGGDEHDVLLGDHGEYDVLLPANQNVLSIFIGDSFGAGNDTIHGGAGDDFILGQQGDDLLFGDDGEDDITGGHNVLYGADGDDRINGGDQADVIIGDNGLILRTINGLDWVRYPPFADAPPDDSRCNSRRDAV